MKKKILLFSLFAAALMLLYVILNSNSSVESVFPPPNKEQVDLLASPYVVFSKPVSKDGQNNFSIKSSPNISFSQYWSADGKTLYLAHSNAFIPSTKYQINILSPAMSYSWEFKTIETEETFDQGRLDRRFNKELEKFYSSHPWYENIPPRNDDFFIGFDASKNEFFVDLYPKNSSPLSIEVQTDQLKNRVLQTLRSIGINTLVYKIVWTISPR